MKIAVASENQNVSVDFGHCENFNVFDIQDNKIVNVELIANPGHKPGFLPVFLNELGVNLVISGGMGAGAIEIFNEKKIDVITGAKGNVVEVVNQFLLGNLVSTGSVCHNHEHHDECGGH